MGLVSCLHSHIKSDIVGTSWSINYIMPSKDTQKVGGELVITIYFWNEFPIPNSSYDMTPPLGYYLDESWRPGSFSKPLTVVDIRSLLGCLTCELWWSFSPAAFCIMQLFHFKFCTLCIVQSPNGSEQLINKIITFLLPNGTSWLTNVCGVCEEVQMSFILYIKQQLHLGWLGERMKVGRRSSYLRSFLPYLGVPQKLSRMLIQIRKFSEQKSTGPQGCLLYILATSSLTIAPNPYFTAFIACREMRQPDIQFIYINERKEV